MNPFVDELLTKLASSGMPEDLAIEVFHEVMREKTAGILGAGANFLGNALGTAVDAGTAAVGGLGTIGTGLASAAAHGTDWLGKKTMGRGLDKTFLHTMDNTHTNMANMTGGFAQDMYAGVGNTLTNTMGKGLAGSQYYTGEVGAGQAEHNKLTSQISPGLGNMSRNALGIGRAAMPIPMGAAGKLLGAGKAIPALGNAASKIAPTTSNAASAAMAAVKSNVAPTVQAIGRNPVVGAVGGAGLMLGADRGINALQDHARNTRDDHFLNTFKEKELQPWMNTLSPEDQTGFNQLVEQNWRQSPSFGYASPGTPEYDRLRRQTERSVYEQYGKQPKPQQVTAEVTPTVTPEATPAVSPETPVPQEKSEGNWFSNTIGSAASSNPYAKSIHDTVTAAATQLSKLPEQAAAMTKQAVKTVSTYLSSPGGTEDATAIKTNGQLTPVSQNRGIEMLTQAFKDPQTAFQTFQSMPVEAQLGIVAGLSVTAVGVINALAGQGGWTSLITPILGLGLAAGAAYFGGGTTPEGATEAAPAAASPAPVDAASSVAPNSPADLISSLGAMPIEQIKAQASTLLPQLSDEQLVTAMPALLQKLPQKIDKATIAGAIERIKNPNSMMGSLASSVIKDRTGIADPAQQMRFLLAAQKVL